MDNSRDLPGTSTSSTPAAPASGPSVVLGVSRPRPRSGVRGHTGSPSRWRTKRSRSSTARAQLAARRDVTAHVDADPRSGSRVGVLRHRRRRERIRAGERRDQPRIPRPSFCAGFGRVGHGELSRFDARPTLPGPRAGSAPIDIPLPGEAPQKGTGYSRWQGLVSLGTAVPLSWPRRARIAPKKVCRSGGTHHRRAGPIRGSHRRRLLATGGAAGAAAWSACVRGRPTAPRQPLATACPTTSYRVPYSGAVEPDFTASSAGATADLKLIAVTDLQPDLAGSEDAFALRFTSSHPLESGTYTFFHKDLGVFDFLIGPIENRGEYEVVVNRSVNAPKHPPRRQRKREKSIERGSRAAARVRDAHLRRASVRRTARGLGAPGCGEDVHVKTATFCSCAGGWSRRCRRSACTATHSLRLRRPPRAGRTHYLGRDHEQPSRPVQQAGAVVLS